MLKVGLDIQVLQSRERSGFGYYVDGLYRVLKGVAPQHGIEIIGLESRWNDSLSTAKRFWHDRFELEVLAQKHDVDIVHQPCFSAPKSRKKVVWTLHDLRSIVLNETMSLSAGLYWKKWVPYSAHFADQIVATSEATCHDAVKYLGLDHESINVITIGAPLELETWRYDEVKSKTKKQELGLVRPYLASLGTIQPIKNYPFLIDVFVALRHEYNLKHQLVIIGSKGWDYPAVQATLSRHGLTEGKEVIITGYVTDDEKWSLLHDAEAFLFSSLYEGFGIPPIEAQAVGTPVMSTNNSSLPWVVGDAGVLVSATDIQTWLAGWQILQKTKAELVKKGHANVKRFGWDKIAAQWCEAYKALA